MNEQPSPVLSISETARRIGVSEARVRQMIEQGHLSVYRTDSGKRQVQRESVEKVVANRRRS